MKQFLSSFSKHKKIILFAALFLAISGIIIPERAHGSALDLLIKGAAGTGMAGTGDTTTVNASTQPTTPPAAAPAAAPAPTQEPQTELERASRVLDYIPDRVESNVAYAELDNLGLQFVVGIPRTILLGTFKIAAYSNYLLSYAITNIMDAKITVKDTNMKTDFSPAWTQVRNLADMIIVLGFVLVGIATSLRIRDYEAKKLLWPLIAIALLVNFSGLFCGLIIDASNMTFKGLGLGSAASPGTVMMIKIVSTATSGLDGSLTYGMAKDHTSKFIMLCFMYSLIYLGLAFTFLYLSILLYARYAILALLFILSPLAFTFWIFPATKKMWSEWWDNFLKWAFVGTFGAFVLSVSAVLVKGLGGGSIESMATTCALVLIFLYIGFKMTAQNNGIAAMAGSAIMGAGKAAGWLAIGAVGKGAQVFSKSMDKASGGRSSAPLRAISNTYGRMLEGAGLRPSGSTLSANSKQVEERAGLMGKEYGAAKAAGDTKTMGRIQQLARTGKGPQGAAAMKTITEAKDLGATFGPDISAANQRLTYAESAGATGIKDKAVKENPNFAGTPDQVRKAVKSASPAQAAEWSASAITPQVYNSLSRGQIKNIGDKGSPELVDKIKAHQYNPATNLLGQTHEWKTARKDLLSSTAAGSRERMAWTQRQNQVATDSNYA